ncbi:MAG: hypothetical protein PPP58_06760 [Natronomonas sp.]
MRHPNPHADLEPETAFQLLSNDRRRAIVYAVAEADGPLSVEELTAIISASEEGLTPTRVDPRTKRAVRGDLEQRQLPELVGAGILVERADTTYVSGPNLRGLIAAADAAASHLDLSEGVG